MASIVKKISIGLLIGLLVAIVAFVVWGSNPLGPMPEAMNALKSDSEVQVIHTDWYEFLPQSNVDDTALIFYPGGRVDVRSYAPLAKAIAQKGYPVYLLPMPLSLAILNGNAADSVIQAHPEITNWVLAGHSLGGVMAASYAFQHQDKVNGLVLLASYPMDSNALNNSALKVVSIYGSNDGEVDQLISDHVRDLLPQNTTWVRIEGGNHAQMGWYGPQPGDGEVTISRSDQQDQVIYTILSFLGQME